MNIEKEFKATELPRIYKRENIDCFFDPFRKKLIKVTPEEMVRQKIASLLVTEYGVPMEMISLEVPMSHFRKGATGRADIVVYAIDSSDNSFYPVLVVECKNRNVVLTDQVVDQVIGYCNVLLTEYFAITNGIDFEFAAYSETENRYLFLTDVPSYNQMIANDYAIPEINSNKINRYTLQQLNNEKELKEYNDAGPWVYGSSTLFSIRSFAVNFHQALMDYEHKLPFSSDYEIELIEDLGQRLLDYDNAGGGHYCGSYRSFFVKDRNGEPQVVSISIFGTEEGFRGENRTSYTSLVVSVDKNKVSHNSLQLNVDKFAMVYSDEIVFSHSGIIGGFKCSDVISRVRNYSNQLKITNGNIQLGAIKKNKILYLDDSDMTNFIYNLIDYALLREEVRTHKRK